MVLRKPVDVVVERVDAGGRHDPSLAHRASEEMLVAPRLRHALLRPRDDRSERAAEPFGEAERDRVELAPVLRCRSPARDRGVHEPRAVEMHREPVRPGLGDHLLEMPERPDPAAAAVVGVLDADEPGRRRVQVARWVDRLANVLGGEDPVLRHERLHHEPGMDRRAAELVAKDVRHLLGDHLVAGLRQRAERDLVRHRGSREEDRLLVAEELRRALLERDHSRILALLLVPDLGIGDRPPHLGRGLGQRVGAEVDHGAQR